MTVASEVSRMVYAGNGVSTNFPVSYYFLANTDPVVLSVNASGVSTTLVLTTDYTVTGAGVLAGGSITTTVAPAAGTTLVIYRDAAVTQLTDYQQNDPFPAESHERALDRLTMIALRAKELLSRTFRLADSVTGTINTTLPSPAANNVVGWNESATGLQNFTPQTFASIVAYGAANADVFTGNGVLTSFTLTNNPIALNNLDVSLNGATLLPTTDYQWTGGTTLTTSVPVPNGQKLLVRYSQGLAVGAVNAGSLTEVEFSNSNVALDAIVNKLKFLASGAGAVYRSLRDKLREQISITDFLPGGYVTDGSVDYSSYLRTAALSLGSSGGIVNIPPKFKLLIDSNVTIPSNISIRGSFEAVGTSGGNAQAPYGSLASIIINSAATISLMGGSGFTGVLIIRKGMTFPAADSSLFAGTAITFAGDDCFVFKSMILGFNKAIFSTGMQRPRIEYLYHDNNNGIDIQVCYDISYISNNHAWPFSTIATGVASTKDQRSGTAYNFQSVGDWNKVTNCFSWGYLRGFHSGSCNSMTFLSCGADNLVTAIQPNQIGYLVDGSSKDNRFIGCQTAAQETGYYFNSSAGTRHRMVGSDSWACSLRGVFISGGDVIVSGGMHRDTADAIVLNNTASVNVIDGVQFSNNSSSDIYFLLASSTTTIGDKNQYSTAVGTIPIKNAVAGTNIQVASAAPLNIPHADSLYDITGTTNFGSLNYGWRGRTVTLHFLGSLTVFTGSAGISAIRLANNQDFVTQANSTLTLKHNGVQWYEIGRSAEDTYYNVPRILARSAVAVTAPADTTEDILATITVPANRMGPNGSILLYTTWSMTNNANVKTVRVRFGGIGGTKFTEVSVPNFLGGSTLTQIDNRNNAALQVGPPTALGTGLNYTAAASLVTSSVDTTASTTIVITAQKATAGDTITLESYKCEIISGA